MLDDNDDLVIGGVDFVIGDSLDQDVSTIIRLNQGDLKSDPILGPNLYQMINSNATKGEIRAKIKLHLERDRKNYEDIKNAINFKKWQ